MTMRLHVMSFSPYSEKARWALDHHHIAYTLHEHVPMMGELSLRFHARRWTGKVSVPLAVDGGEIFRDSLSIARHADRVGRGSKLFEDDAAVEGWDARSSDALTAARVLLLRRQLEDRESLTESLPPWIPGWMRGAATPMAASAIRHLARKYGANGVDPGAARRTVESVLAQMRTALGGREHLLGRFSYADITMAVVLQMVSPVAESFIPLGAARRRAWTEPELAREYADLVEWRDALYAQRRRGRAE